MNPKRWIMSALMLALSFGLTGCPAPAPSHDGSPNNEHHAPHDHGDEGPRHGQLIELGHDEFHAELIHDDAAHSITIYLLDSKAKAAVPITDNEIALNLVVGGKPRQVKLAAAPQDDDPPGHASRFTLIDEQVVRALDEPETKGRLNVTIGGKSYTGNVAHGHARD